jgi:hypothetical protein
MNNIIFDQPSMELILKYLADSNVNILLRKAAAVFLGRYIKDYWVITYLNFIKNV